MRHFWMLCCILLMSVILFAQADYSVRKLEHAPELPKSLAVLKWQGGVEIAGDDAQVLCRWWLRKEIPVQTQGKPNVLLPQIQQGTLVGIAQYLKEAEGCHEQPIPKGMYTGRYMHLPQDGNHIGVFPTQDFLLLLPVTEDAQPKTRRPKQVLEQAKQIDLHPYTLPIVEWLGSEPLETPVVSGDDAGRPTLFFAWDPTPADPQDAPIQLGVVLGFDLPQRIGEY